jgi:hypothetical protein
MRNIPDAISARLPAFVIFALFCASSSSWAQTSSDGQITSTVYITSIVINGVIRIAAIGAGTYIVWLGHNTLVRGIKGEFEFSGRFGRLKGSAPGLLFVLLGTMAIGWALATRHVGTESTVTPPQRTESGLRNTSVPPAMPDLPSSRKDLSHKDPQ